MMRIKTLLLAGATIPAALLLQPVLAFDAAAPLVLAQQDPAAAKPAPGQKPAPPPKPAPAAAPPRPQAPPPRPQAPPPPRPPAPAPQQQRPQVAPQPRPPAAQPQPPQQRPQVAPQRQPSAPPPPPRQERREQRQELRQEQRRDNTPRPERREQRQELRKEQRQEQQRPRPDQPAPRQEPQKPQPDERQKPSPPPLDQKPPQAPGRGSEQDRNRPAAPPAAAPDLRQRPGSAPVPPASPGQQGQTPAVPDSRNEDRARRLDDVRGERREIRRGNQRIIQEGSRSIVQDGNRKFIRHDENERFRRLGRDVTVQQLGNETRTFAVGPGGTRVVTVTDANGRLLRRSRFVNDREVVIIDNRPRGGRAAGAFFLVLPAIALGTLAIPPERYIVEAEGAPPEYIYGALMAPPIEPLARAYTLDEIRYSPELRDRMPRIDLDTITFDSGSWEIRPDQYDRLAPIAEGIRRAIAQNPNEVFLIEGHTDATGNDDDNLSLSDRRAEAVSVVLTDQFQIPPENLTTQGYGEQQLKVPTQGPERINRRVTLRRITPLLQQGADLGGPNPVPADQIPEEQRQFAPPAKDERVAPPRGRQSAPAQQQFAPR